MTMICDCNNYLTVYLRCSNYAYFPITGPAKFRLYFTASHSKCSRRNRADYQLYGCNRRKHACVANHGPCDGIHIRK